MGIRKLPSGRFRVQIRRQTLQVDEVYDSEEEAARALEQHLRPSPTGARSKKAGGLTVDEAWTAYRDSRAFLEKRPKTQRSEDTHVKPVLVLLGNKPVRALCADDVDGFIVSQSRAGKAPDTVRNAVASLSSVLNYCRARSIVSTNVTIGVKRPSAPPIVRRMPAGHLGALMTVLNHPRYRYRATARLALLVRETGARPGEWSTARWDGVNLDAQRIVFEDTKYKRQPRTVPITAAAMALLAAQLEDITINNFDTLSSSDWVFPVVGRDGELKPIVYTSTLRDMKKDSLLPRGLRAHNGRHEFISSLVEGSDLDDSRIMSLVGHHSPASMQRYTHARNIRFLPQLEALEESRRKERARELSKALGVPVKLIDSYLDHLRKEEAGEELPDTGNELLYEADTVSKLAAVAQRLGKTESERMRKLLEIQAASRGRSGSRRGPAQDGGPQGLPPTVS